MKNKTILTKVLAIVGSILVFFPIIATFATSGLINGTYQVDYLIPFEIFPVFLIGALMILWASFRAHEFRKLIGWSLVAVFIIIAAGILYIQLNGLASGETEPTEAIKIIGFITVIVFCLLESFIGVIGILLNKKLFSKKSGYQSE